MRTRKFWVMGVACLLALMLSGGLAWADNPHFISGGGQTNVAINNEDGSLLANFKIAGLGSNENVTVQLTAVADVIWQCVNKSGKCPKAANKVMETVDVIASGEFTSDQNGQVEGTLTFTLVAPSSAPPTCGGGQTLKLAEVEYTFITLTAYPAEGDSFTASGLPTTLFAQFVVCN
jgi:hypothetical protein